MHYPQPIVYLSGGTSASPPLPSSGKNNTIQSSLQRAELRRFRSTFDWVHFPSRASGYILATKPSTIPNHYMTRTVRTRRQHKSRFQRSTKNKFRGQVPTDSRKRQCLSNRALSTVAHTLGPTNQFLRPVSATVSLFNQWLCLTTTKTLIDIEGLRTETTNERNRPR